MHRYRMAMRSERRRTKVLLQSGEDQILKAVLPPPADDQAAPLLVTALSLWVKEPLSVVLSVADWEDLCGFDLHDGFGGGVTTGHYLTRVHVRCDRFHHERIVGLGDFAQVVRLLGGAR